MEEGHTAFHLVNVCSACHRPRLTTKVGKGAYRQARGYLCVWGQCYYGRCVIPFLAMSSSNCASSLISLMWLWKALIGVMMACKYLPAAFVPYKTTEPYGRHVLRQRMRAALRAVKAGMTRSAIRTEDIRAGKP